MTTLPALPEWYLAAAITLHSAALIVGLTLPWRIRRAIASGAWDGAVLDLLQRTAGAALASTLRAIASRLKPKEPPA